MGLREFAKYINEGLRNSDRKMPSDFIVGGIYKMHPAERSHVKTPYYVEVIEVGEDFIVTNIPDRHTLKISGDNWDYQTDRMEYIGTNRDLLYNQENILPE